MRARAACLSTVTLALALAALLAGGAVQAAQEAPVEAAIVGRAYQPPALTVGLGQTVVWQNRSVTHHTVTSTVGQFDSGSISPGESYTLTFSKPGTFEYRCTIHPTMKGSVVVLDVAPGTLRVRVTAKRTGHGAEAVVRVQAARAGAVLLQARGKDAWQTVAHGQLDSAGEATLTLAHPARRLLRVALPATLGQPRQLSPAERSPA